LNKDFIQKTTRIYFFFVPHAALFGASFAAGFAFFAGAFVASAFAILSSLFMGVENKLLIEFRRILKNNLPSNYIYLSMSRFFMIYSLIIIKLFRTKIKRN